MTGPRPRVDRPYDAVCVSCADRVSLRLTDVEYRALKPMRCARCNGRMFVEAQFETFRTVDPVLTRVTRSRYVIRTAQSA